MEQLLRIHTVPIRIGIHSTRAKVEISSRPASMELDRERKGLTVEHKAPVLHVDSSAARSSMNLKSPGELARVFTRESEQAARDFTAAAAQQRHAFLDVRGKGNNALCALARERIQHTVQLVPAALPAVPAQMSWDPQKLTMRYEKDQLAFRWRVNRPQTECSPASVRFRVEQYPKVEIEFVGGTRAGSPSADPARGKNRFQATA